MKPLDAVAKPGAAVGHHDFRVVPRIAPDGVIRSPSSRRSLRIALDSLGRIETLLVGMAHRDAVPTPEEVGARLKELRLLRAALVGLLNGKGAR